MAASYSGAKFGPPSLDDTWGKWKVKARTVTLSGTYTTGGDPIPASVFGLRQLLYVLPLGPATDGTLAYDVSFVRSSRNLKLWETGAAGAGSAEKGSGESLTSITLDCLGVGY